jgi:ABC-2 type transport system ATP-binding protein
MGKKKTVMLSTHIMQEVEAICDRVIIINNGRIVADDTPDNIKGEHKLNDKKQTVIVEFSGTVTEDLLASLTAADHFRRVDNKWIIQSVSATDLREDIFQFAVDHDLKVLEMQKELKSLEEVFHKLTNQKPEM